jgi:hypothetical protein
VTYDQNSQRQWKEVNLANTGLWKEFDALAGIAGLVVRGANSGILSAATVPDASPAPVLGIGVPDQGHAPLLMDIDTIARIGAFVSRC